MKRVDVVSALIFDDLRQNVLMVRNKHGESSYWSLPGGAVEPGETLEQALRRETKEESGFEVEIKGLYSLREVFFTGSKHHALLFTFQSIIIAGNPMITDPDEEILEIKWVDLDSANKLMSEQPVKLEIEFNEHKLSPYFFRGEV